MTVRSNTLSALRIESTRKILKSLSTQQLQAGMRTFILHGTANGIGFTSCFVACMYGNVGTYGKERLKINMWTIAPEDFDPHFPTLLRGEVATLSSIHYENAEELLHLCNLELEDRGEGKKATTLIDKLKTWWNT